MTKAASYLLSFDEFTTIRNYLIDERRLDGVGHDRRAAVVRHARGLRVRDLGRMDERRIWRPAMARCARPGRRCSRKAQARAGVPLWLSERHGDGHLVFMKRGASRPRPSHLRPSPRRSNAIAFDVEPRARFMGGRNRSIRLGPAQITKVDRALGSWEIRSHASVAVFLSPSPCPPARSRGAEAPPAHEFIDEAKALLVVGACADGTPPAQVKPELVAAHCKKVRAAQDEYKKSWLARRAASSSTAHVPRGDPEDGRLPVRGWRSVDGADGLSRRRRDHDALARARRRSARARRLAEQGAQALARAVENELEFAVPRELLGAR